MILASLPLRSGVSIEVSGHIEDPLWRTAWHFAFAASNVLLAVLIGAALGNVVRGVPLDASGDFFYPAIYRAGFASQPTSVSRDDGLSLSDLYTAPVCRCAPPENKPTPQEMKNCQMYLEREIEIIQPKVIVVLGRIAFNRILDIYRPFFTIQDGTTITFSHAAVFLLQTSAPCLLPADVWLVCSYHPSRQNTQTGRLTMEMFDQVGRWLGTYWRSKRR